MAKPVVAPSATYERRALAAGDYDLIDASLSDHASLTGLPLLRAVWIVMGVTLFVIFGWTAFAPLDRGVTAVGQVSTESARQVIQHLDGGIVKTINVQEGQTVKAGQVLMTLDDTLANDQYQILRQQYFDHLGERAMLEADIQGGPIQWPQEMLTAANDPLVKTVMASQQKVLNESRGSRAAQKAALSSQIGSLNDQVRGLKAQTDSLSQQGKLIDEESSGVEGLYKQGYAPKSRLLELQRSAANLQGTLGQTQAQISAAATTMGEKRVDALQIDARDREDDSKRLSVVINETLAIAQKMADQSQVLARTVLRSPVDGVVLERHIATIGGVVRPGEPVIDLVPTDQIVITGRVRPSDIQHVKVGMAATIKFTGMNVQTTPRLTGRITYVSADALTDQKTGQSYYEMRASVPRSERGKLKDIALTPGMPADIMVDGGSRTLLQYLLEPVGAAFSTAFREG
jgi:HlyD family type I secretion membrane fusion protein